MVRLRSPNRCVLLLLALATGWALSLALALDTSATAVVVIASTAAPHRTTQCLGVLIAPATVLASTACLEQFSEKSAALIVQGRDDRTIAVASVSAPPSIDRSGSFSLLDLKRPMRTTTPALLQTMTPEMPQDTGVNVYVGVLEKGKYRSTTSHLLETTACVSQLQRLDKKEDANDWRCIDTGKTALNAKDDKNSTAIDKPKCIETDGFLFSQDKLTQRPVLWGLVWDSETRSDPETVGMPTSTPVQTVYAIRSFLASRAVGHQWITIATRPKTVLRPSPVQLQIPLQNASHSRSADDAPHAGSGVVVVNDPSSSHGSAVGDIEAPPVRVEVPSFLYDFGGNAALLTTTRNTTDLQNATLAYVVTARHLVLPRRWIRHGSDPSLLQWVTTLSGTQVRIKAVISEADFYADRKTLLDAAREAALDLVVVEMDGSVDDVARPIVSKPPQQHVDYSEVVLKLADHVLESEGTTGKDASRDGDNDVDRETVYFAGVTRFVESQECGHGPSGSVSDPALLCAQVTDASSLYPLPQTPMHHIPSVMGVLELSSYLVGFTLESASDPHTFTVLRLASPVHKEFLDAATNHQVTWQADDAFAKDAAQIAAYPTYRANLYAADADGDSVYACPGLLVGSQFVLTTASCLVDAKQFSFAGLKSKPWEDERLVAVQPDYQIPHPLYQNPAVDFLVDLAVIKLAKPVLDITPVALNPGYPAWVENATIDGLDAARSMGETEPHRLTTCASFQGNQTKGTFRPRGLCMTQATSPHETNSRKHRPGQPLITKTPFGAVTASGFSIRVHSNSDSNNPLDPEGDDASETMASMAVGMSAPVFLSFADNANFINGYASGVVWGKQPTGDAPFAVPSAAPAFVVGLRITRNGPNFCSGTLVASGYVLTAAHCVGDALANYAEVSGGLSGPEVLPVVRNSVRVHESYGSPHQYSFDAAVLELETPASAYGIALDLSTDYATATRATMFGFGVRSSKDLDKPSSVHAVDNMPIYTRTQCAATLPEIDGSMLCAGGEKGNDACQGDSGGPLVLKVNGREVLAGIVSAGYGCGLEGVPGVYARASSLVRFVQSYVAGGHFEASAGTPPSPTVTPTVTPSTTSMSSNESRSAVDPTKIESYSGNNSHTTTANPSSSDHTGTANPTTSNSQAATSEFESPLLSTNVPKDLQMPVRTALMSFLMGDWSTFVEDPLGPLNPLVNPSNQLTLRSHGNANGVLTILQRHEAKPLYARRDRFGRGTSVKGLWEGDAAAVTHACAM